jgi:subtilisin family serine protease
VCAEPRGGGRRIDCQVQQKSGEPSTLTLPGPMWKERVQARAGAAVAIPLPSVTSFLWVCTVCPFCIRGVCVFWFLSLCIQHCGDKHSRCRSEMNVQAAWKRGYTGKNVVVTILDDGIERNHPDLAPNYVSRALEMTCKDSQPC